MAIVEWKGEPVPSSNGWFDGEQVREPVAFAQCIGAGEVALHFDYAGRGDAAEDGAAASLYLTPVEATKLAERLQTAADIAEKSSSPDAS